MNHCIECNKSINFNVDFCEFCGNSQYLSEEIKYKAINLLLSKRVFRSILMRYAFIPSELIIKYRNRWNWKYLCENQNINWDDFLIESNSDKLDWEKISLNEGIKFSETLIKRYQDKWNWNNLLNNPSIKWDENLKKTFNKWIELEKKNDIIYTWYQDLRNIIDESPNKYIHTSFFNFLISTEKFYFDQELLDKYIIHIDWYELSKSKSVNWSEELLIKFSDKFNWNKLSANEFLPWDENLICNFWGKWNKSALLSNDNIFWDIKLIELLVIRNSSNSMTDFFQLLSSQKKNIEWNEELIDRFLHEWDWNELSSNIYVPWNISLIEKYKNKVVWGVRKTFYQKSYYQGLCVNTGIEWDKELIDKYSHLIIWESLSSNENIKWSTQLFIENKNSWFFGALDKTDDETLYYEYSKDIIGLSSLNNFLWSEQMIDEYIDKWHWGNGGLSSLESLPWSLEFIDKYKNKWDWDILSLNKSLPWSIKLIKFFDEKWSWYNLEVNDAIPWSLTLWLSFADKWSSPYNLYFEHLTYGEIVPKMKKYNDFQDVQEDSYYLQVSEQAMYNLVTEKLNQIDIKNIIETAFKDESIDFNSWNF